MVATLMATMLAFGAGDVHLPETVSDKTPCVLLIHGGGWSAMKRQDVVGIAEFLQRDLGCVVYNIDYRLASKENPWPACGEDCVKAAEFMFSDDFAKACGVRPRQIWVMGGSAGGHLALWTGLTLPLEKVAGIVSISGIGDPLPDAQCNPGRYRALFGGADPRAELYDSMNPLKLIRQNGPKILCTHATGDKVVPIESAKNFAAAYRAAGNRIEFFEYPHDIEPGLTGHCIWRPGSDPHRLISALERTIAGFVMPSRVPEPRPVRSEIEVHAFYYPGTEQMAEWDQIEETSPQIKPLLGWYDEGNPEVVDWQIKWAVEHGISAFCVDWYWNCGDQRLDHWVKAYYKARHRRYLKWYLMYANHNEPGSQDEDDLRALMKFWIDNYFRTPEYYRIDGKPVVVWWSVYGLERDFGISAEKRGEGKLPAGEASRRALALMDKLAKEAGLPGIHQISMWLAEGTPALAAKAGFDEMTLYNFDNMALEYVKPVLDPRENPSSYSFETMCAGLDVWRERHCVPGKELRTYPTIPTGWNDLPRSFEQTRLVYGLTPEKFARACRDCRTFCDRHGIRRVYVAPVNEWQEGSYAEPNEEFGFALYDAIRDAFCEKPAEGWPKNVTPKDVGLGPYDYPPMPRLNRTSWDFDDGTPQGWYRHPYGTAYVRLRDGALRYIRSFGKDRAAIRTRIAPFEAQARGRFVIRAKITPGSRSPKPKGDERIRLWWGTEASPAFVWGQKKSVPGDVEIPITTRTNYAETKAVPDGRWHEYAVDLSSHPHWRGRVNELLLDVGECLDSEVLVDFIRFEK